MEIRQLATQMRNLDASAPVDVWTVSFALSRFDLGICYFDNPLGTDADILQLAVAGQELVGSPIVRVWDRRTMDEFNGRAGLWVTCYGPVAQLISGRGSPSELIGLAGSPEQYQEAQFFVVPSDLVDLVDVECELTVTCMN